MPQVPDYAAAINASPYHYVFLAPDLTIIGANDTYLRTTQRSLDQLIGRNVFEAFPPAPGDEAGATQFRQSFARVLATGKPDTISLVRYAVPDPSGTGSMIEKYWSVVHTPVLDEHGKVRFLVQNPIDVTDLYLLKKALRAAEKERESTFQTEGRVFTHAQMLEAANRMLDAELSNLRRLFEQAPGFVAVVRGTEFVFELANEAYYQLVGHRDLIGKPFRDVLPDLEGQGFVEAMESVFTSGKAFVGRELKAVLKREPDKQAEEIYLDLVVQPIMGPSGAVSSLFIQGHDITAQKRAQDELRVSNERWKLAIEGAGDGVWDWNMETDEVNYSRRWKEIIGYGEHEIGSSIEEWRNRLHPDDLPIAMEAIRDCIEGRTPSFIKELRLRCKDGGWKWTLARAIVVTRDAQQRPLRMTGTMTDISEKKESDERIWHHANFDALTGLPNRRLFRDRLDHEVRKARRNRLQVGLLFIDLDRFKEVNDLLGHDAGDTLLAEAARRLCQCVRASDTVARLGGDEFTVILGELDNVAHVEYIAQKILAALAEPFQLGNEIAYVSGSVGITLYPGDARTPEDLIRNADQAMYAAKSAGRNQFSYFTRSMQEQAHQRLRLGGDLRNALHAGQLQVHYQPVVDLQSGRIVKAEALLRWHHPGLGEVAPANFIPLAEESGLINEMGDWVFEQALTCSQRWSALLGMRFQVCINTSPVQFLTRTKAPSWAMHLRERGLPGDSISVDITENTLLNVSASVSDQLMEYRHAGIQIGIDDFGTGYSSMAYLKKFGIDYLKIAQPFVQEMANSDTDRAIAESVIVMAHRLGLTVIAEGIETAEQRDLLRAAGCDFGQGFLYAAAAPPEEFERMLTRGASGSILH